MKRLFVALLALCLLAGCGPSAPEPAPDPAPDPEPMTLAELQKNVATRCAKDPGIKNAIRSLVHEYAESVSCIPEDKRSEFMARLKKL